MCESYSLIPVLKKSTDVLQTSTTTVSVQFGSVWRHFYNKISTDPDESIQPSHKSYY